MRGSGTGQKEMKNCKASLTMLPTTQQGVSGADTACQNCPTLRQKGQKFKPHLIWSLDAGYPENVWLQAKQLSAAEADSEVAERSP